MLLALTQTSLGFAVNGNRNWLALGPLTVQPSEIAKLAIILWAADVYARKEKLLGNPWQALIPVAPVIVLIPGLVVFQRDLGTALVLFAILLGHALGGRRPGPALRRSPCPSSASWRSTSPPPTPSGAAG